MSKGVKKGIILAGGTGTRLYPVTRAVCKQLLPVYDKPMIYYPLTTFMQMDIKQILLITTAIDQPKFQSLLGDGTKYGIEIEYAVQEKPLGIAEAFIVGEKFIAKDNVALILGDNIFYGTNAFVETAKSFSGGSTIFAYYVSNPERYGVVELDKNNLPISIIEKPAKPKSHFAVTGLYIYDSNVVNIAQSLKPSTRGELEITDINNAYLKEKKLEVIVLERGSAWLDTGTHESMLEAGNFIETIEKRQGLKIGCIEETALRMKYINRAQFRNLADELGQNSYRNYLELVLKEFDGEK
ncbi:MAG TPA: glucose-1-phosphate thymidylyltransferase RfbA [candidate division Zixibacteria bacterium]|nr:glucose-1-phosphate thymidylyltransferase RfbA [candidate division Zixibacteria bacterium]